MKLTTLWIVRDASPTATIADVCFALAVETLDSYVGGCPVGSWRGERHTVYTERDEAMADAHGRLMAARRTA